MMLEMDFGNTCCKWRVLNDAGSVIERDVFLVADRSWQELFDGYELAGIKRILVASVQGVELERQLSSWALYRFGLVVEYARSGAKCAGVKSAYSAPESLGVDRWLAMIAAYNKGRDSKGCGLVVIDAGSALTIDLVDRSGQHCGGYIIPGLQLMQRSLLADTKKVRFEQESKLLAVDPGASTAEAVVHGVLLAQVGAVEKALVIAEGMLGDSFQVWVTGGDGKLLLRLLGGEVRFESDLVLDGLRFALAG